MRLFHDPADPLTLLLLPPADETPEQRLVREQREADAKRISDAIDDSLRREKAALKKQNHVRVLLLGQAESGKSTTLKNFRVKYAYKDWVRERAGWRSVIQLNIIRSILTIVDTLRDEIHTTEQDFFTPYDDSDLSSLSDSDEDPIHLSDKVQMLLLRLSPLRTVEKELKQRLGAGTDEVRADVSFASAGAAGTAGFASRLRRPREFCVRKWNNVSDAASKFGRSDPSTFAGPGPGLTRPQSSRHDSNVVRLQLVDEPTEVIASCRTDMMLLWTDPDVRDVLQKRKILLELSAGFFLDDLDRVATRDYEPSDEDILRARLRTVGVQEYRMRIESAKRASADWIFYDVGGARTMRSTWMPFFDNIHAIIFLAPVSTFDERLLEDPTVNRLEDSVLIWRTICSSKLLAKVTLVLFLNKTDILKRKLKSGIRVAKYLVSYGNRPNEPSAFLTYLREKFTAILNDVTPNPHRVSYFHTTNVTDMKSTAKTLTAVEDGVLRENLRLAELA
ncbi:guanine nucleotide-binding protein alpha subunit [Amanita muscaria]